VTPTRPGLPIPIRVRPVILVLILALNGMEL